MLLTNGKKRIPIGYEDFKQLIDSGFMLISQFLSMNFCIAADRIT